MKESSSIFKQSIPQEVYTIDLNWSEDQCRGSKLQMVLPLRRSRHGTRPGLRGSGPRGPYTGDTDQWVFLRGVLTDEDKTEINFHRIATTVMFQHHLYIFGGETYRQKKEELLVSGEHAP